MPPLILEFGVAIALIGSIVRITSAVNRMEQKATVSSAEILGKISVLTIKIDHLESDSRELKKEIKETRRFRFGDQFHQ